MRKIEYFVAKDSCKKEYRTKITTITGIDEIKKVIEENECLHDWTLEFVACDGEKGHITTKPYDSENLFHFDVIDIQTFSIDLDVLIRWITETKIAVVEDCVTLTFHGIGIQMTAKEVTLSIQEQE